MIESLEKFIKVAETKSFTKAALELNITQPALSISISRIEKEFNTKLFQRTSKAIILTKSGEEFLKFAYKVKNSFADLKSSLNEDKNKLLRLGMIDNVGESSIVKALTKTHSKFNLEINNSQELIDSVIKGKIDIAIVTKNDKKYKELETFDLFSEEFVVVGSKANHKKWIKNKDLIKFEFLTYPTKSNTFKIIKKFFEDANLKIKFSSHSTSPHFMLTMAIDSDYLTILPKIFVQKQLDKDQLVEFKFSKERILRDIILVKRVDFRMNQGILEMFRGIA